MKRLLNKTLLPATLTIASLLLSTTCTWAQTAAFLNIGQPAPALTNAKWLKGTPVPQFEKGKIYVVEFWATWCGPCKENIPHLTELAKKYKGQVSIIGIDIWERAKPAPGDYVKRVVDFVKQEGDIMDYNVAIDSSRDEIANSWVVPAGEKGIPCSFIVDKEGKIVWIGHPATLGEVLEKVVAGTYDPAPVQAQRELVMRVMRPIDEAIAQKNYAAAATHIEKALAEKPDRMLRLAYPYELALFHCDVDKGVTTAKKILTDSDHAIGAYQMLASLFATQNDLAPASYTYGYEIIDDAIQRWPNELMFTVLKTEALFNGGKKTEAIRQAKEAIAASANNPKVVPAALEMLKKSLAKYETAK